MSDTEEWLRRVWGVDRDPIPEATLLVDGREWRLENVRMEVSDEAIGDGVDAVTLSFDRPRVKKRSNEVGLEEFTEGANPAKALEVAVRYGSIDGEWHKEWVIDQMVRALTGKSYEEFVARAKAGDDGPDFYPWSEGTPP